VNWWLVWQGLAYVATGAIGYLIGNRPRRGVRYRNDPPVTRNWPEL
jgi:hypothetical protein